MTECKSCTFWEQHTCGNCSQKIMTQSGQLVNIQTSSDYGCTIYEYNNKNMDLRFWADGNKVYHSGITSEKYIIEIIDYLKNILKQNK